jgi:glutathione S-transferase
MLKELVFYTNPQSRGRIVHWMLEEIGAPYAIEVKDYGTTMKTPDYLTINPMGKVPAIKYGEVVVTETPAICAYLADAFPAVGRTAIARALQQSAPFGSAGSEQIGRTRKS